MDNFFLKKAPTGEFKECGVMHRYEGNPILTAKDIPYPASYAFNAGAAKLNGTYYIAPRVDLFGEVFPPMKWSGTGFGTSEDGIHFTMAKEPCHFWYQGEELLWVNDTRLTVLDGELYASFCFNSTFSERPGIAKWRGSGTDFDCLCLAVPQQRNMILCPFKKDGLYMRLERPANQYQEPFHIWYSLSPDLRYWGDSELLLSVEDVPYANKKIGGGAPPIKTKYGYLLIFHAVDSDPARAMKLKYFQSWDLRYSAGAALFASDDPTRLVGITKQPLMLVQEPYETHNDNLFVENTVFPCGAILEDDERLRIYYGAGDWCTCMAETTLEEVMAHITPYSRIADRATVPFLLSDWKH